MKKALCWLLLVMLMALPILASAEEASLETMITQRDTAPDTIGLQAGSTLTLATPTKASGYFATDFFGNNVTDMDVRDMLHGYGLVARTRTSGVLLDGTVVRSADVTADAQGNRTYTIRLQPGLAYNDGTAITAKDFVFSALLCGAPEIAKLGGMPNGFSHFVGYDAYQGGQTEAIQGIRLLSDDTFSLQIGAEYLPYFYGMMLLDIIPYPMHVIAPGCDIADDGQGVYITRGASADDMDAEALGFTPGEFSAEMLGVTLLDPGEGYVFNPDVTSGPYALESFDKATGEATFSVNAHYLGNYEGETPHIEKITLQYLEGKDMQAALENGEVDLLHKIFSSGLVSPLLERTGEENTTIRMQNYPRAGLAYLAMACEAGITQDVQVRRALAHAIDRESLATAVSPYALLVNGHYGMGQWITTFSTEEDTETGLEAVDIAASIEELALAYDPQEAKDMLQSAGWAYDDQGESYTQGIRYRKEADGTFSPLVLRWAKSIDSPVTEAVQEYLVAPLAEVGISVEITEMPFTEMMEHFYRQKDREYDLFFLSSSFGDAYDPYFDYNTDPLYQGTVNTSGLQDETLMALAKDMRTTSPQDRHAYAIKWLKFQERWLELMPVVPLYSNVYFDFYTETLQDYDIVNMSGWGTALVYAWFGEAEGE